MKLIECTHPKAGYFSHIEIDKKSLSGMGIDERTNVFVVSPSVVAAMEQDTAIAERMAEAWHSHFKHLILAMPGLIEAANDLCNKINELNAEPVLKEWKALCDALEPYKDII